MKYIKYFLIIFLFLLFDSVYALDERTIISEVEVSSNVSDIFDYGAVISNPTFNVTSISNAQFSDEEGGWHVYEKNNWYRIIDGYRFNSGTWHYRTQLRIDSDTYKFSNSTSVYVDGEKWSFSYCSSCSSDNYSVGWVTSPSYVLEPSGELEFFSRETYRIYKHYVDNPVYSFSVAGTVEGGTSPYTFSKVSGPTWVNVSSDGTISGTPSEVGTNPNLVVRVTDAEDSHKEITVPVDKTLLSPEMRELIESIEATSNISSIPTIGGPLTIPTFNITNVEGPYFANYNCGWYKKIGDNWKLQEDVNFTPGIWQYRGQVILTDEPAETHRLSDDTLIVVDGVEWSHGLSGIGNEYYAVAFESPEYMIKDKINSIELNGTINKPKVGNDITEPIIWAESLNNDQYLTNYVDIEARWEYKTGENFFDWKEASGKFEANKTYHIRVLISINTDIYDLENIATFPVTFNGYKLTQFQLNNKTVGEFIEFDEIKEISIPNVSIVSDNNKITLTWDNQSEAVKYKVYRSIDEKNYNKVADITTNSYIDKGLTYNKVYYYKVKACDTSKCSSSSEVVSKKIRPNKVVLSIKSAGTNNVKLAWDRVRVTGYEVSRSTDNKNWTRITTITKNETLEYNNKKLSANKTYYYKVRAYKTVSGKKIYGSWSSVVSTKTAPVKPTLEVKLKDYNAMNLVIGSSKGATKYVVQKSLDGKTYTLVENLPNAGTLAQEDLEVGKTYYYALKACNLQNRCSGWVKVSLKQTPKTPKLTLATTSKKVNVTVGKVNGADGYRVYRATSKNGKYELVKIIYNGEELSFKDKTTKGKTYYYKVRSYIVVDESKVYSPFSSIKSITSK